MSLRIIRNIIIAKHRKEQSEPVQFGVQSKHKHQFIRSTIEMRVEIS